MSVETSTINANLAFDWSGIPDHSIVVDVGGGVGTAMLPIARKFANLRFVIQDLPPVLEDAVEVSAFSVLTPCDFDSAWIRRIPHQFWSQEMPEAMKSHQVVFEGIESLSIRKISVDADVHLLHIAQDFFKPQPKREVAVFFLKQILHDWSDEYCSKILKNLRNAANPTTRLVFMESIVSLSCHDPSADHGQGLPGEVPREAPRPLLANYGAVNEMVYNVDIGVSELRVFRPTQVPLIVSHCRCFYFSMLRNGPFVIWTNCLEELDGESL